MRPRHNFRSPLVSAAHLVDGAFNILLRHVDKKDFTANEEDIPMLEEILEITLRIQVMTRFALHALQQKNEGH